MKRIGVANRNEHSSLQSHYLKFSEVKVKISWYPSEGRSCGLLIMEMLSCSFLDGIDDLSNVNEVQEIPIRENEADESICLQRSIIRMRDYESFMRCSQGVGWSCHQEDRVIRSWELGDENMIGVGIGVGSHGSKRQVWV